MSVFVVAVLMAGLGFYWGSQRRDAGAARPVIRPFAWVAALYLVAVGVLFVPLAGTECPRVDLHAQHACELVKSARVAAYLIFAAGILTGCAGAYFGGNRRVRWWLLVAWALPLLATWAVH
ncbi:MAG: hypothetical protein KGL48_00770 [Sphingomonadales bacterium]|nr:hypothetical protein [Sphingomonadales bacterium]MDE2567817.1 hypothetical protein [Sphingomonadales bacterium]